MDNPAAFALMKTDLGFLGQVPEGVEDFMLSKLAQAEAQLRRAGLTLDPDEASDVQLLASYAAHLYRHRDAGPKLPPMIRDEIHDRQVAKSTGGVP